MTSSTAAGPGCEFALRIDMRQRLAAALLAAAALSAGCHPGPVLKTGAELEVGGTIAGVVTATGGSVALADRKVTATNVGTHSTYDAITNITGGYTIKVPEGTYRVDVEVRNGEVISKRPDDTQINNGDLDPGRDFQITAAASR
jgi:hypothetical protein